MSSKDLPAEIPPKNGSVASKNSEISGQKNRRASSEVATSKVTGNEDPSQQRKDKVKKKPARRSPKTFERSEGRITRSMTKAKKFQR